MTQEDPPRRPVLWPPAALIGGMVLLAIPGWRDLLQLPGQIAPVHLGITYGLVRSGTAVVQANPTHMALTVGLALGAMAIGFLALLAQVMGERWRIRPILALLMILGGLAFISPPSLSTDVFTYVVRGVMVTEGIDAVSREMGAAAVPPSDNLHSLLRVAGGMDPWIGGSGTPYGPLWIWVMGAVHWIAGSSLFFHVLLFKLLGLGGHLAVLALLWRLWPPDDRLGRLMTVALVGLNPTAILETTAMAHNEGMMMALWVGATLAVRREKPLIAGLLLGFAAGIKWVPLVGAPVLAVWLLRTERGRHRAGLFGAGLLLAVALAILPLRPWEPGVWEGLLHQSTLFGGGSLSHVVGLVMLWSFDIPAGPLIAAKYLRWTTLAIIALVLVLRARRGLRDRPEADQALFSLLLAIGAASFFHAWYALWALPFAVLARRESPRLFRASLGLSLASPFALAVPIAAGTHGGWVQFGMFAVWAIPTLIAGGWPVRR